ncbi:hypothetical protein FACS189499_03940 [Clostridia bacterium]|nr:hypothetical protein FACS189499_03940 [Clostridia bacterium]
MGMLIHRQGKVGRNPPAVDNPSPIEEEPPEVVCAEIQPSELELLRAEADSLGVNYHPNIGADKLRERIKEAKNLQ